MSKTKPRKKRFLSMPKLIIFAVIILLALFGLWAGLRTLLVKGLVTGIKNAESQGYQIGHGDLSVNGFPFAINARSQNISVRAPNSQTLSANTNWFLKIDELFIHTKTLNPLTWSAQHAGQMRVDMRAPNGDRYMFDVVPANIHANASVNLKGLLKAFDFDMSSARINSLVGATAPVQALGGLSGRLTTIASSAHFSLQGIDIILSNQAAGLLGAALGNALSSAEVEADITHWDLLQHGDMLAWQNSAGRVTSQSWALKWGDMNMRGNFDIGFANSLPDGTLHIEIENLEQLMDKLIQNNVIPAEIAGQARMFLSAIKTNEKGRQELDITIQNGVVKYGFLTLYKF